MASSEQRETAYTVGLRPAVALYSDLSTVTETLLDGEDELRFPEHELVLRNGTWQSPTEIVYSGWTHPVGHPESILNADRPHDVLESLRGIDSVLQGQWRASVEGQFPNIAVESRIDTAQANLRNVGQTANTGDIYYDFDEERVLGALRAYVKHPSLGNADAVLTRLVSSGVSTISFVDEQQLVARTRAAIRNGDERYNGVAIRKSPVAGRGFEAHPVNVAEVVPSRNQYSGLLLRENGYLPDNAVFDSAGNRTSEQTGHVIDELIITDYDTSDEQPHRHSLSSEAELGAVRLSVQSNTPSFNAADGVVTMHLDKPETVVFECGGTVSGEFDAGSYTFGLLPYAVR